MFRVLLVMLSLSTTPAAQAGSSSQVELSAAGALQTAQLSDQRFEPIYQQQNYQDTCSRQVVDHVSTTCSTVSSNVCHGGGEVCTTQNSQVCNSHGCTTVPRRSCHSSPRTCESVPRRVCSDHAVMRTEHYSCTRTRTVQVGQRLVKTFQHNVEVVIDRPELLQGQKLTIALNANEASVSASLLSSFALNLLTVESQNLSNSDSGSNQIIGTRIIVHVDAATQLIGRILMSSVQDLALHYSSINFKIAGAAELAQSLVINVNLSQIRPIINDKTIVSQSINSSELSLVAQGGDLIVALPLEKLGAGGLKSKRHNLSVSISIKRPSLSVLNTRDLEVILNKKLESSLSGVYPN